MKALLIDGYNVLAHREGGLRHGALSLEKLRQRLLHSLAEYRQRKPLSICVVFDGTHGVQASAHREQSRGLTILYSAAGQTADDLIRQMLRQRQQAWTVISSDREILRTALDLGLEAIDAASFSERLDVALFATGREEASDARDEERPRNKEKKGPSHRLSKKERRRARALRDL